MLLQEKQNKLEKDEREGGKVIDMRIEKRKKKTIRQKEQRKKRGEKRQVKSKNRKANEEERK